MVGYRYSAITATQNNTIMHSNIAPVIEEENAQ